jgi:uncharacterized protein DUF5130
MATGSELVTTPAEGSIGSVAYGPTKHAGEPPAFSNRQLARIDEALTMASHESGIYFTVYVGNLDVPVRGHAERLHAELGAIAPNAVLVAISPGQRVLEIVTGAVSSLRLPDRACALAALSMTASFGASDLTGGIVNGLRMLSDQAGLPSQPGR